MRPPKINKDRSLTESVYQALRQQLLLSRIAPGTQLKSAELASRYGVSFATVREALARLSSEGLVEAEPQRGFRAASLSVEHLQDLTDARIEIEIICMRRSLAQFDMLHDVRLKSAFETLLSAAEYDDAGKHMISELWNHAHSAFHEALVAGCKSDTLLQIRRQLFDQSMRYRSLSLSLGSGRRDIEDDHRPLLEAVLRRDEASAVEHATQHIRGTAQILLAAGVRDQAIAAAERSVRC